MERKKSVSEMKKTNMANLPESIANRISGWHSAKKPPCPEALKILVYSKEYGVKEGWYSFTMKDGTMYWNIFTARGVLAIPNVTHWRYMPKTPRLTKQVRNEIKNT